MQDFSSYSQRKKIQMANLVIEELGRKKLMSELQITNASLSMWKKIGLPHSQYKYLKLAHPNLRAWTI